MENGSHYSRYLFPQTQSVIVFLLFARLLFDCAWVWKGFRIDSESSFGFPFNYFISFLQLWLRVASQMFYFNELFMASTLNWKWFCRPRSIFCCSKMVSKLFIVQLSINWNLIQFEKLLQTSENIDVQRGMFCQHEE